MRRRLLAQGNIMPEHRVLDLGSGTGTYAILVKQAVPGAEVVGLDADGEVLEMARKKARAAGVEVQFVQAPAQAPPFEPRSFDRVFSTLAFHHLTTANKLRTLERARDLLRPGGEIHIADWGAPHNGVMRRAFLSVQLLDGFATTADSVRGILPSLMKEAGFFDVVEVHREMTVFGTLAMYRGVTRHLESTVVQP